MFRCCRDGLPRHVVMLVRLRERLSVVVFVEPVQRLRRLGSAGTLNAPSASFTAGALTCCMLTAPYRGLELLA